MQIIIDIPEEIVEWINEYSDIIKGFNGEKMGIIADAIANGTPLPKGHGRLIDADEFLNDLYRFCDDCGTLAENPYRDNPHIDSIVDVLENLPTIISSDEETQNEDRN